MNTSDHRYPLQLASLQGQHAAQSLHSRLSPSPRGSQHCTGDVVSLSLQDHHSSALTKLPASKGDL